MSYLDHIHACNNFDPAGFRPFLIGGQRVGYLRHATAEMLRRFPDVFAVGAETVALHDRLDGFDARSDAVDGPLRDLAAEGVITAWREEYYPVTLDWHMAPLMRIGRAAAPVFGVRAFGVHLNGYVRKPDGLHMWVAHRAQNKPTFPGMLDNMVAGGQPIGLGLMANLVKECGEEAGVPEALARQSVPVGLISYTHEPPEGVKPDQMFCFDLALPAEFTPTPVDGEVESFSLWPVEQVAERVRDTFDFKFNCNLVVIDFLIRHGVVTPDTEPDYAALVQGLRTGT
jgi:isopentenyldiphosphate isomerase